MKRITIYFLFALLAQIHVLGQHTDRAQWTEDDAWKWHNEVGIIKGFNAPVEAYPGMSIKNILEKASSLGFNSVRLWMPADPDECVRYLHDVVDWAATYNMTVSPVLNMLVHFGISDKQEAEKRVKNYLNGVLGEFRNEPGIIFWDLVNEPALRYSFDGASWEQGALEQIEWSKNAVRWAREVSTVQPITTSALFLTEHIYNDNKVHQALKELEGMSDVHNFHLYDLSVNRMQALDDMVALLKSIGDRPIICTEAVGRTRGGTFARSLTAFSKYHIHFYSWGMYTQDFNWDTAWGLSSFEPYEPWFHDVLHPDGYPYDWRDIDWVRNFHFSTPSEISDPGAEVTERWNKWRAWKWMATGPVKGLCLTTGGNLEKWAKSINEARSNGYNSLWVSLQFDEWKRDSTVFFHNVDTLLHFAALSNMSITPSLLTDDNASDPISELDDYVSSVVKKYGFDTRVLAWELYTHPGEKVLDTDLIRIILATVFRAARFEFPNQPLMATPSVSTRTFDPDFDYYDALIHGHRNGWNKLAFGGIGDPEFCNYVWSLSDIISMDSESHMQETGWLLNIANRYGRPVVCTRWNAPDAEAAKEILDLFSKNKVFWYNKGEVVDKKMISSFQFRQIATPRR